MDNYLEGSSENILEVIRKPFPEAIYISSFNHNLLYKAVWIHHEQA